MTKALGIHVFAGGFSLGVKAESQVVGHLETGDFGVSTARSIVGDCVTVCPAEDWPSIEADWVYGNPRCTSFSVITGQPTPFGEQTHDILELCRYGIQHEMQVIVWESVQGAYTTGRAFLDMLRDELFAPHGYRIAHIFVNALSFGNPQFRQRYFFVAYKGDRNFNVEPPDLPDYQPTVFDMIGHLRNVETRGANGVLEPDDYTLLKPAYMEALKVLPNGFHLNSLGRCASHLLPSELKEIWDSRTSEIPFSLHCPRRLTWFASSPVLTGSCAKLIHPQQHRPCTLRELSLLMGWHDTCPIGQDQAAQLGKGVCPDVGRWLAQQVNHYLSDAWGSEDWESKYNPSTGIFMGGDCHGAIEKCFDLNSYFVSTVRMVDGVETLPVKLKVRR